MKYRKRVKSFLILAISRTALIAVLICVLVFASTIGLAAENKDNLVKKFFGEKASYQGIITLWNIDTFEGGTVGKSYFLETVASRFEARNKGALIKVENLSISQMQESLKKGTMPDIVSIGTGIARYFQQNLIAYSDDFSKGILSNFYASGLFDGRLFALPYMAGGYTLISTAEKIQNAGGEWSDGDNLKQLALELSWTKKQRKNEKQICSLTFGQNEYTSSLDCFSRAFENQSVDNLIQNKVLDTNCKMQSPYQAYANFVAGTASVLLGTQRDVARIENRVLAGKMSDIIYQPLGEYLDLVQYIGICTNDEAKQSVCMDFAKFLISDEVQKSLSQVGMFSVTGKSIYKGGVMKIFEESLTEKTIIRSVF